MWNRKPEIRESEVRRFLGDQMASAEAQATGSHRTAVIQRLLSQLQLLPEQEFDVAFRTLEALVEKSQNKKSCDKDERRKNPEGLIEAANRALTQSQKKSA